MSEDTTARPRQREDVILGTIEGAVAPVARLGYALIDLGLGLLPQQARQHMRNAVRELSYAFVRLPGDFAELAGAEIERWAAQADDGAAHAARAALPEHGAAAGVPADRAASAAEVRLGAPADSAPVAEPVPPLPASDEQAGGAPSAAPAADRAASAAEASASVAASPSASVASETTAASTEPTGGASEATPPPASAGPVMPPSAPASETRSSGAAPARSVEPSPSTRGGKSAAATSASASGGGGARAKVAGSPVKIAHIQFDPLGQGVADEYVLIRNTSGEPVELTGWQLHDGAKRHVYIFPTFVLAPGAEVKLWTRDGINDAANLYWGRRTSVWNNQGDTGVLLNASGAVVSRYTYSGKKGKR